MRIIGPRELEKKGIMGMNMRNIRFIGLYNDRSLFPLVDDKLKTKKIALKSSITVPDLIGKVEATFQLKRLDSLLPLKGGFAIKPSKGSGGKGILVILKIEKGLYYKPSGETLSLGDIKRHISNILAGLYSLGGKSDVAIIESLIEADRVFDPFSFEGVPDVRVIIFKGYPVMAMMRLSTSSSDGKANLHQGAVGVGIDIVSGQALRAVQYGQEVFNHPDTGVDLHSLSIPHWDQVLNLASGCFEMTGLGYLGADIVLDKNRGPMLLELNARPGLAIQIANGMGLLKVLNHVANLDKAHKTIQERIVYMKEYYSLDN